MSYQTRIVSCWMAMALFALCPLLLAGQNNAQNTQPNQGRKVTHPLLINVTGCLKKNPESGGYYVADQDGKKWELSSTKVDLSKQLFHTVSVSGHPSSVPTAPEGSSEQSLALDVTEVDMLSPSCTR